MNDQEVILNSDRGPDRTVFVIRHLDPPLHAAIAKDFLKLRNQPKDMTIGVLIKLVRFGLRSWNLKNADNTAVPLTTGMANVPGVGWYNGVTDDSLNKLEISWMGELAEHIIHLNYPDSKDSDVNKDH